MAGEWRTNTGQYIVSCIVFEYIQIVRQHTVALFSYYTINTCKKKTKNLEIFGTHGLFITQKLRIKTVECEKQTGS